MSRHLCIKAALAVAFGVLAGICAGQGVPSIVTLAGIRQRVGEVDGNRSPSVAAVNDIRSTASDVRIVQRRTLALSGIEAASRVFGAAPELSRRSEHREAGTDRFLATVRAA